MKQISLSVALILGILSEIPILAQTVYKMDELKIYSWNDAIPDWEQDVTQQFTFDNGGNKETNVLNLSYPDADILYQTNKSYNANNDIVLGVNQYWNDILMQWENGSQEIYSYDGFNNLIEEVLQMYNPISMGYTNSSRSLLQYSGSNLVTQTTQTWNSGSSSWVNTYQYEYAYSGSLPIEAISSNWDSGSSTWIPDERDTPTYSGNLVTNLQIDKYNAGNWDDFERVTYTYNGDGLETEYLSEKWDGANWIYLDRDTSIYDINGNKIEFVFESWNGSGWVPYYRQVASYSVAAPLTLSTEDFISKNFKIYPNPTSGILNISSMAAINKIEMFNVLGMQVLSSSFTNQLNLEGFKSGVYVLKVYGDNSSTTKRVIIK